MACDVTSEHHRLMKDSSRKHEQGFTLIELCVAMAVLIIAGFIAIPQLARLQSQWTLQGVTQTSLTTLNAARIHAMKSNTVIAVCASADNQTCGTFDASSRFWLIVDERDDSVLRSFRVADGYALQGAATRPRVRFQPNGWSSGANMTIKVCDPENAWRKDIIISNAGRIRSQTYSEHRQC